MPSTNPFPEPEPGIDALVRAQLDAEAARADARAMADRVLAQLAAASEPQTNRPRRAWGRLASLAGVVGLAAAVLVAAFVLSGPREATATPSPAEVVQGARGALARNDTRCYRVTIDARAREAFPLLAQGVPRTLCTRGDRFVVEPGFGGKGAWGRDGSGRVWVAPDTDGAAAFNEAELPPLIRNAVKVHELEPDTLLDEVLSAFDLTWSEPPAPGSDTYSVTATRRGNAPALRLAWAELVIEKKTKVIRSLTLRRGGAGGHATFTFTLLATVAKDDMAFTPEGYIRPGAPVFDHNKRLLRHRLLRQHLGEAAFTGS